MRRTIPRRIFLAGSGLAVLGFADLANGLVAYAAGPQNSALAAVSGTSADAAGAINDYLRSKTGAVALTGDYFIDSVIEIPAAISSFELTAGSRLKVRGDHTALSRTGTIVYREQLKTAMTKGKTAITVGQPTAYRANDYVLLAGDDTTSGTTDRYGYLRRVTSVSGTTVNLDKALPRTVQIKPRVAAVTLSRPLKIFGGGEIFHTAPMSSSSPLIRMMAVDTPQVLGLIVHDNGAAGVWIAHCRNGVVDCTISDLLDDEANDKFGYGVNVVGSTRGLTVRGTISRVRHAVTTNSGPFISVLGAAGEPEDCRFECIALDCTDKSVDTHRLGWNTTIVPNVTGGRGGVQVRADNTKIVGGTIVGSAGPGISVHPMVAVAPTVTGTAISNLKPSGSAILADSPVSVKDVAIRDSYGVHIVLSSNSTVIGGSILAGGAVAVRFRGSNNSVTDIQCGNNITTPYTEDPGATHNVFRMSTTAPEPMAAPVATKPPSISGTFAVGNQLSVDDGTWTIGPLTMAFTWMRDGVPISNATNRTYRTYDVVSADLGKTLTVVVTARRAGYADGTATSAPTATIAAGLALVPVTVPVLSGTPKPGQTLTVTRGTWDPSAQNTSCKWFANGVANGSTGTTYLVKSSDVGKLITVAVTATRTGWTTATFTAVGLSIVA
ncbi:hypothetical protein NVV95_04015 [Herbiconiux sp. CPCC 205716]|uniref:Uncharacterized protein n=1 Tax=Herbiconiux gentiana TaxID=2970912 RepID=A0ABT2GEK0_9MICO|nr:hypothetical protein [Herbiconiux gentiana]MCS5713715.1 hypothetical protein [Herbiconiux gentiana]